VPRATQEDRRPGGFSGPIPCGGRPRRQESGYERMKRRSTQGAYIDELRSAIAEGLERRYTIDRLLGSGGMALVFAARGLEGKRPVAIKGRNPEIASAVTPARFVKEILWSANLQHPHIVPVLDSGEANGF